MAKGKTGSRDMRPHNEYMSRQEAQGTRSIRSKGKTAIKQVRAAYRQAGVTPPESLRLPTPKRKPR
jgi:hypothetical protein